MDRTPRLFLPSTQFGDDQVELRHQDLHYLKKVLRKRAADNVVLLDGQGRAWKCALGEGPLAKRVEDYPAVPSLPLQLSIGLALCKGSRFEAALEKLAELGVSQVTPLVTERTQRKAPSNAKEARWQEIALSSSAVAGRMVPLDVRASQDLKSFLQGSEGELCYCHPGGASPSDVFSKSRERLTLLVGPEGGFSPAESALFAELGTQVDLGPLNLRVETAATVACGLALNLARGM